jgi:hypothetical protein
MLRKMVQLAVVVYTNREVFQLFAHFYTSAISHPCPLFRSPVAAARSICHSLSASCFSPCISVSSPSAAVGRICLLRWIFLRLPYCTCLLPHVLLGRLCSYLNLLSRYWWMSASIDAASAPSPASAPSSLDISIVCWVAFLCAAVFLLGSIWFLLSELRGPVSRMLERCYGVAGFAVAATVEGEAEMDPLLSNRAGRKSHR